MYLLLHLRYNSIPPPVMKLCKTLIAAVACVAQLASARENAASPLRDAPPTVKDLVPGESE